MEKHWIYHPQHAAKIVDHDEYTRLLDNGWFENPGHFGKKKNKVTPIESKEEPVEEIHEETHEAMFADDVIEEAPQRVGMDTDVLHGTVKANRRGRPARQI